MSLQLLEKFGWELQHILLLRQLVDVSVASIRFQEQQMQKCKLQCHTYSFKGFLPYFTYILIQWLISADTNLFLQKYSHYRHCTAKSEYFLELFWILMILKTFWIIFVDLNEVCDLWSIPNSHGSNHLKRKIPFELHWIDTSQIKLASINRQYQTSIKIVQYLRRWNAYIYTLNANKAQ